MHYKETDFKAHLKHTNMVCPLSSKKKNSTANWSSIIIYTTYIHQFRYKYVKWRQENDAKYQNLKMDMVNLKSIF